MDVPPGPQENCLARKFADRAVSCNMSAMSEGPALVGGQPHGLRARKKLATRQALGAAAMRLAIEHGLENVLVEDIAAAADVSPRTFNNYFASKYEAICALPVDQSYRDRPRLRG